MVAGGLEVSVVRASLPSAVNRDLGTVHVQHHAAGRIDDLRLGDQVAADPRQTGKVFWLRQQSAQTTASARSMPLRAPRPSPPDQPDGRVLREPLGVVDILVARQPAVYRLPHEVGQRQPGVLSAVVGQVTLDEFAQPQAFIQLTHQEQAGRSEVPLEPWKSTLDLQSTRAQRAVLASHPPPLHLRTAPTASKPASIRALVKF